MLFLRSLFFFFHVSSDNLKNPILWKSWVPADVCRKNFEIILDFCTSEENNDSYSSRQEFSKTCLNSQKGRKMGVFRSQSGTAIVIHAHPLFADFMLFLCAFKRVFENLCLFGYDYLFTSAIHSNTSFVYIK